MIEYIRKVGGQIVGFIGTLSPGRKAALVGTLVAVVVGISSLFFWAGEKTFHPLLSNLSPDDSASIIRVLREKNIPFTLDATGRNISVPPENLYELRLELATAGLPQSGLVGYEVFDKQTIGTTSFVQKVNQKRALEGELMRTINTIKGVKRSRVHLALPQRSPFVEDQKKASASIVVDLEPGTVLADKQIFGIGNLVARGVEGLDISDVVVMDSHGKVLSKNPGDPIAAATATQLDFRQKFEQDLEKRVEALLGRVVGDGKVVARVTADIDFSQVTETQTVYDQDGSATRSVQRDQKSMEGTRPGPYGLAGAQSNTPGQPPVANAQVKSDTKTTNETINYEIPQTVRKTSRPSWNVSKLSVAVMVDGKTVRSPEKDGQVKAKVEPWAPEKIQEFEKIVIGALGIDKKRGDSLEIKNIEFTREDFEEAQRILADNERKSYFYTMLSYGVIAISIVLFFLLVVRPFIKWLTENTIDSVDTFLPQTIEELERLQKSAILPGVEDAIPVLPERVDPEKVEGEMIKEKIITLVDANPHKAALVLRDWLHADGKKRPAEDAKAGGKAKGA